MAEVKRKKAYAAVRIMVKESDEDGVKLTVKCTGSMFYTAAAFKALQKSIQTDERIKKAWKMAESMVLPEEMERRR